MAIHYPVYVENPPAVGITATDFYKLSYMGLSGLLVSWRFVLEELKEGGYQLFCEEGIAWDWKDNYRFEGLDWKKYKGVEMCSVMIPKDHFLIKTIETYFSNRIMKLDKK